MTPLLRRAFARPLTLCLPCLGMLSWPAVAGAEIFVVSSSPAAVRVFADAASGDALPLRSIAGATTTLGNAAGLALDLGRRELYVANGNGSVLVFDMDVSGDVAPKRSITGANTELATFLGGLALDVDNDELWVASPSNSKVLIFDRTANGNVAPKRSITGASTGLSGPVSVAVDLVHDEVYVSDAFGSPREIAVFDRAASGDATPKRQLTVFNPRQMFVDLVRDELIFLDVSGGIYTYARTASGSDTWLSRILGASSSLEFPIGLVVTSDEERLVADGGTNGFDLDSVLGFTQAADGDVPPVREIAGNNPNLSGPSGISSDHALRCSEGAVVSACLFRDGFEAPDLCRWSTAQGASACGLT